MEVSEAMKVRVTKITEGKDGFIYVTVSHPFAQNKPSLKFSNEDFIKIKKDMI